MNKLTSSSSQATFLVATVGINEVDEDLLFIKDAQSPKGRFTEMGIEWILAHPEGFSDISHVDDGSREPEPTFAKAA